MGSIRSRTFRKAVALAIVMCVAAPPAPAALLNLAPTPLFVGSNIPPKVMLTVSKDQQLFKKAYNDYTDLDGDGQIESTYKHAIDYYGYFDAKKCYLYSTGNQRFEPASVSADKYCAGQWSGNFLNWATMSRMDTVRKLLYGGMRIVDQTFAAGGVNAETVLERAFVPTDAHAWAKFYNGADIAQLTPFNPPTAAAAVAASTSGTFAIPSATGDYDIPFTTAMNGSIAPGDQIRVQRAGVPAQFFVGAVLSLSNANKTVRVRVDAAGVGAAGSDLSWSVTNLTRTGISLCNVTLGAASGANMRSSTNTQPPLIRVAQGNFGLWNANERWQCQWFEESNNYQGGFTGGLRSNGNQAALSEIQASAENPSRAANGLGTGVAQGEYIARVQACVPSLLGAERCKRYPNGNYKPIGLLQHYGDAELIHFGLMTGSHARNISGGVLRKNVGALNDEVRTSTDGTFVQPSTPPGAPRSASSAATPPGIINTLNYMRIYGYLYSDGTYIGANGDNCTYQLTNIVEDNCTSWGNPMSEMFFESVRYFAGKTPNTAYAYSGNSKDNELGLPLAPWTDPVSNANYCAPLNVLVFNASVPSADADLRTAAATDINSTSTIGALTDAVGAAEGITGNPFMIGKLVGSSATPTSDAGFELCTAKTISGLGDVSGICPEGPTTAGSYLLAGLAHHAHVNRIRTDLTLPTTDTRSLKITSYGIQLATNVPQLVIPVPGATGGQKVVIQPIYRLNLGAGNLGGGTLVDMKFIRQETVGLVSTGKAYVNWEDSEQGGDYDQDMWGTIEWRLDAAANTITVTTNAISASTANPQGFGYSISGTTKDGAHYHSGIYGFNFTDPTGVLGCTNCNLAATGSGQRGPQSYAYTLGGSGGDTLRDPLWYLAKYGAFKDLNGDGKPDTQAEWDSKLANGLSGQDGVPDNYFLVTNPLGLEAALDRAFVNILSTASATSVAANSTSLQTSTTIYQARFNTNDWSGQVLAYGVQADGQTAATPTWDSGQVINTQDPNTRAILTFNDKVSVRGGVPFRWPADAANPSATEINLTLVDALNKSPDTNTADAQGAARLLYLRGDPSREGTGSNSFRIRPTSKLGDIVHSDPAFVGPPNANIIERSYGLFRQENYGRTPMIYVGANDGMLHGIDATTGREKLAYVPSKTFANLAKLTSASYVHRYFVDGAPVSADALVAGVWRTVLVGGLGGGGQGLFALDVTKPENFAEDRAADTVMWEFNDTDDADLGYVYGRPAIRKMANGRWAAIVSGGYNNSEGDAAPSATGTASLFVIFLDGPTGPNRSWVHGTDYVKIDTGVGSVSTPNGLAPPFPADGDGDGVVDFVYAGDLQGNFWKFDVSSTSLTDWVAPGKRIALFRARDNLGNPQPITAQAEGTLHPSGKGFILAFGTGKYLEPADPLAPYIGNSFYGIWDKNDVPGDVSAQTAVTDRTQLLEQTITETSVGTARYRVVSSNVPVWSTAGPPAAADSPSKHVGWFMDFPNSAGTGERSVFRPLLMRGRLIFTTLIPSGAACDFGGSSFMMLVDPVSGGRLDIATLDVDGNGALNSSDTVLVGGVTAYASGVQSAIGVVPTPTIVTAPTSAVSDTASKIFGTTAPMVSGAGLLRAFAIGGGYSGGRNSVLLGLGASSGRVSWREIIN